MARRKTLFQETGPKVDISPMIDLVFLLLIFFMVASTAISFKKDKRVIIPIALDAKVPELIEGRIIINVYEDGTVRNETGTRVLSESEVETLMAEAKTRNPNARLHLRADRRVAHSEVKKVIQASSRGGVSHVIYSTYVTDK